MPNEYDRIIKENIEAVVLPLSAKLFGIQPEAMEEVTVDLHLTLERRPDVTRRITDERSHKSILHISTTMSVCSLRIFRKRYCWQSWVILRTNRRRRLLLRYSDAYPI